MTLFYGQNSMKSSQKSSAILHFRDSKLKNFPYKASHLKRSTRASNFNYNLPPHNKKSFLRPNSFDIKTVGVKMLCFFVVSYCQDSIKSSLKSSAIFHFRNSKLISPIKPRTCSARLGPPTSITTSPPPPPQQKELPTAQFVRC